MRWAAVCSFDHLVPDRGVCALIDGEQVAVFRLSSGEVCALANRDPFSGAYVLSRGLVGCRDGEPVVVSPMHKQAFSLRTGVSVDEPSTSVDVYSVRISEGMVEVALTVAAVA